MSRLRHLLSPPLRCPVHDNSPLSPPSEATETCLGAGDFEGIEISPGRFVALKNRDIHQLRGFAVQIMEILINFWCIWWVIFSRKMWIWRCTSQHRDHTTWGFAVPNHHNSPQIKRLQSHLLMPSRASLELAWALALSRGFLDSIRNDFEMSYWVIIDYITHLNPFKYHILCTPKLISFI